MNTSLRMRLLLGTSLGTSTILGLLGVAIFVLMRHSLLLEFDAALLVKANVLAVMVEQNGYKVKFELDQSMPEFIGGQNPEYFQMRLDNGQELARSPSLGTRQLPTPSSREFTKEASILPDGRQGRILTIEFTPHLEPDDEDPRGVKSTPIHSVVLSVARDTAALESKLSHLRWLLAGLCGLAILVSGLILILIVGTSLRPLNRLARDIESFPEADLARRLDGRNVPAELVTVVDRLNGLLGRLESGFLREKTFTADVAHELRTPLSGLHTTLQVCRSRPRDRQAYEAMIDKCLKMTGGIRSMADTLLLLARADAGQLPVRCQPVDLARMLEASWAVFLPRARARRLLTAYDVPDPCLVETDTEQFRMILGNLLDNAVSYADEGGTIQIRVHQAGASIILEVCNTASRLADGDAGHLFQRFFRGDDARSDTSVHCGLGLALCRRLISLIGGDITARADKGVFTISLSIPSDGCAGGASAQGHRTKLEPLLLRQATAHP